MNLGSASMVWRRICTESLRVKFSHCLRELQRSSCSTHRSTMLVPTWHRRTHRHMMLVLKESLRLSISINHPLSIPFEALGYTQFVKAVIQFPSFKPLRQRAFIESWSRTSHTVASSPSEPSLCLGHRRPSRYHTPSSSTRMGGSRPLHHRSSPRDFPTAQTTAV